MAFLLPSIAWVLCHVCASSLTIGRCKWPSGGGGTCYPSLLLFILSSYFPSFLFLFLLFFSFFLHYIAAFRVTTGWRSYIWQGSGETHLLTSTTQQNNNELGGRLTKQQGGRRFRRQWSWGRERRGQRIHGRVLTKAKRNYLGSDDEERVHGTYEHDPDYKTDRWKLCFLQRLRVKWIVRPGRVRTSVFPNTNQSPTGWVSQTRRARAAPSPRMMRKQR